jgi:hypothetical protein
MGSNVSHRVHIPINVCPSIQSTYSITPNYYIPWSSMASGAKVGFVTVDVKPKKNTLSEIK